MTFEENHRAPWKPPFRGEIYEYATKINLKQGYANQGPFDVQKSRYLIAPFKALRNPRVRLVSVKAGVQTGKSLLNDLFVPYIIEHDPGELLWLFQPGKTAKKYADERFMPMLDSIPEIAAILAGGHRHDKKKTSITFPHMSMDICERNENNVQTLSRRYVIDDETWTAGNNGLPAQGFARTTSFPNTCKQVATSQGGIEGDDADNIHKTTDQNEWALVCPDCGKLQAYEWTFERDDNTWGGWVWDTNETTKPNGRWNMSRVLETIRHACHFCPGVITDTPRERRRMNDTSDYIQTNPGALPALKGFGWPSMANQEIPWATLVSEYLSAKQLYDDVGLVLPIQQFYQKRLGKSWSHNRISGKAIITSEPYKPDEAWPAEIFRCLTVDCQANFQRFYVVARGWSAAGESRQYYRGYVDSWDAVEAVQHQFKIKFQHVFVDIGYNQTEVTRECIKRGKWSTIRKGGRLHKQWMSWNGCKGSGKETWTHFALDPKDKNRKIFEEKIWSPDYRINPNLGIGPQTFPCYCYDFSDLHAGDILKRHRDGKAAKWDCLPETDAPDDMMSFTNQMHSVERVQERTEKGKLSTFWKLVTSTRKNEAWDCEKMQIIAACIRGIIMGDRREEIKPETKTEEIAV